MWNFSNTLLATCQSSRVIHWTIFYTLWRHRRARTVTVATGMSAGKKSSRVAADDHSELKVMRDVSDRRPMSARSKVSEAWSETSVNGRTSPRAAGADEANSNISALTATVDVEMNANNEETEAESTSGFYGCLTSEICSSLLCRRQLRPSYFRYAGIWQTRHTLNNQQKSKRETIIRTTLRELVTYVAFLIVICVGKSPHFCLCKGFSSWCLQWPMAWQAPSRITTPEQWEVRQLLVIYLSTAPVACMYFSELFVDVQLEEGNQGTFESISSLEDFWKVSWLSTYSTAIITVLHTSTVCFMYISICCFSMRRVLCWMACTGRNGTTKRTFHKMSSGICTMRTSCLVGPDWGCSECDRTVASKYRSSYLLYTR